MTVRGVVPDGYFKQITLLFNPWSATSWLKKRFFDNPADNVFLKTSTYKCNEWLDESDLEVFRLMQENSPRRYWKRLLQGNRCRDPEAACRAGNGAALCHIAHAECSGHAAEREGSGREA